MTPGSLKVSSISKGRVSSFPRACPNFGDVGSFFGQAGGGLSFKRKEVNGIPGDRTVALKAQILAESGHCRGELVIAAGH
jgi:hypothetical protein